MMRYIEIEAVILPIFGKPHVGRPLLGPAKIPQQMVYFLPEGQKSFVQRPNPVVGASEL